MWKGLSLLLVHQEVNLHDGLWKRSTCLMACENTYVIDGSFLKRINPCVRYSYILSSMMASLCLLSVWISPLKIRREGLKEMWLDSPDRYLLELGGIETNRPKEQLQNTWTHTHSSTPLAGRTDHGNVHLCGSFVNFNPFNLNYFIAKNELL